MQVSKRIYSICDQLKGFKLADIGTDHCFLPIFAIKSGKVKYAVGVDINQGPLKSAAVNVAAEGLSDKIELRLGSGFLPISPGECDTAVISGMGGMLISNILEKGPDRALSLDRLILSPQSEPTLVRRTLHRLGFTIINENMIKDGARFYTIIVARPGEDQAYDKFDYDFGKLMLENPTDDFYDFLEELRGKNENIISANTLTDTRKAEILEVNEFIAEFRACRISRL